MDEKTARDMDRLLAEGELSGPEADAILERVLDDRRKKRPLRVTRLWAGGALAAAAAVLIVVAVPGVLPQSPGDEEGTQAPVIEVRCEGGTLQACPVTAALVLSVSGMQDKGFLSAYAEPVGHDAEPVFYYSKESGGGAALAKPAEGTPAAKREVRIGGSLRPGLYRLHAFVADRALGREEMQSGGGAAALAKASVEVLFVE